MPLELRRDPPWFLRDVHTYPVYAASIEYSNQYPYSCSIATHNCNQLLTVENIWFVVRISNAGKYTLSGANFVYPFSRNSNRMVSSTDTGPSRVPIQQDNLGRTLFMKTYVSPNEQQGRCAVGNM